MVKLYIVSSDHSGNSAVNREAGKKTGVGGLFEKPLYYSY
jgi:hypothetical protein